jgi:hypothetical protein
VDELFPPHFIGLLAAAKTASHTEKGQNFTSFISKFTFSEYFSFFSQITTLGHIDIGGEVRLHASTPANSRSKRASFLTSPPISHSVCLLAVSKPQGFLPLHHYRWQMLKSLRQMRYNIHEGKVSPQGGATFLSKKRAWCEEAI